MRFTLSTAALLFATFVPALAHADTIVPGTYNFSATAADDFTLTEYITGTITFTALDTISSVDITTQDGAQLRSFTVVDRFTPGSTSDSVSLSGTYVNGPFTGDEALDFVFDLPGTAGVLTIEAGGTDEAVSGPFAGSDGNAYTITSGTLTAQVPPAVTPEPSSLILLGTGALGVAGVARRRLFGR